MRIALISDIHGNAVALDAVLADIRHTGGATSYWLLGDLFAMGPDPVGVMQRINTLSSTVAIRGNTERVKQEFTATIQAKGKRRVIQLPFDPNTAWGGKERHDVTGTVNGFKFRGPLEHEDGEYQFALGPAWFRDSGLATDATVTVVLSPEGPQITAMADDLQAAFAEAPAAATFFNTLPTFYRKNYMRWIDSAKRPETRANRIAEMIVLLGNEQRER